MNFSQDYDKKFDADLVERVIDSVESSLDGILARPSRITWFLVGAAVGSLAAIYMDPVHGRNRRESLRTKFNDFSQDVQKFGQDKIREFQGESQDMGSPMSEPSTSAPTRTH